MLYSTDGTKPLLGVVCLAVALTGLAGCSMGPIQLSGPAATGSVQLSLSGNVRGGQQPITGATLQLYAVGSGSYGAAATPLISSTVKSDTSGNFSISGDYTCPSTGNGLVYILAKGGNPGLTGGTNNAAIALAAPLGACSSLSSSTTIQINEITTAATAYALGQYFTPTFGGASTDSFGAPSTAQGQQGITNAFATAANLVTVSNGSAVQTATLTGTGGATITVTPEYLKLQTVADILASCVNSSGVADSGLACSTLFADVAPSGGTAPTDTLQAAVDMSLNPTSSNAANVTALYALTTANPPYPAMSTAPTDWTLGIQYTDPTSLPYPEQLAVDAAGNVWVLSNGGTSGPGALTELSPTGSPLNVLTTLGDVPLATTNGKNVAVDATPFTSAGSYDPSVWIASESASVPVSPSPTGSENGWILQYNATSLPAGGAYYSSKSSYALSIDASNNTWVGNASSSAHFSLFEFPAGTLLSPVAVDNTTTVGSTTYNGTDVFGYPNIPSSSGTQSANGGSATYLPEYMGFDTTGSLWISSGASTALVQLTSIAPPTGCPTGASVTSVCFGPDSVTGSSPYTTTTGSPAGPNPEYIATFESANFNSGTITNPTSTTNNDYIYTSGTAAGLNAPLNVIPAVGGGVWTADSTAGTNTISLVTGTSTGTAYGSSASLSAPHYVAMDGAGNIWVTNKVGAITGGSPGGSVSEFNSAGTPLSPTSASPTTMNPGYIHAGLNQAYGIGIDPSGNVWVADETTGNAVEEIVGAAAPTVTPLALALSTSKIAAKP